MQKDVLDNGLDAKKSHFVTAFGIEKPDAALLLLPIHGMLDPRHSLIERTIEWLRKELGAGEFLYRYRMDDGVGGPEGAWSAAFERSGEAPAR